MQTEIETNTAHQALYRKWRPRNFDEVSGQDHITSVLKNEVATGKISHAYLFCGSRGTGKTSCAKILSRAVNCLDSRDGNPCGKCENCLAALNETTTDIVEMDAASNTGVEYIRDIRDAVVYAPSMLKYRVYIIDEVHMLSGSAFNALLKTLEEPPSNVIFILATTEVSKIPVTVISRCQRFDFRRIAVSDISSRLKYISEKENIEIDDDAAYLIARLSLGGMRDAVSLLDLCSSRNGRIDLDCVRTISATSTRESIESVAEAVADGNRGAIFTAVASIYDSSLDISPFWLDLIRFWRDMLVCLSSPSSIGTLDLLKEEKDELLRISAKFTVPQLIYQSRLLDEAFNSMQRGTTDKRLIAEMTLVKMSEPSYSDTNEALLARISKLEEELALIRSGSIPAGRTAPAEKSRSAKPRKTEAASGNGGDEKHSTAPEDTKGGVHTEKISNWIEVIDRVSSADALSGAFLDGSFAVRDTGKGVFTVFVDTAFTATMIESDPKIRELLERSIRVVFPGDAGMRIELEAMPNEAGRDKSMEELINGGTL